MNAYRVKKKLCNFLENGDTGTKNKRNGNGKTGNCVVNSFDKMKIAGAGG